MKIARCGLVLLLWALAADASAENLRKRVDRYARVDIRDIGVERLNRIKELPGVIWWVECDRELLVRARPDGLQRLSAHESVETLKTAVDDPSLVFVSLGHGADAEGRAGEILVRCGRFAVMKLFTDRDLDDVFCHDDGSPDEGGCAAAWMPFVPNTVLASAVANQFKPAQNKATEEIQVLVDAVNGTRYLADIAKLATFSRVSGSAGVTQAGDWLFEQFSQLPDMKVQRQHFTFGNTRAANIIATLKGKVNSEDIYVISAHYDSIASRDGASFAPGAEDNASGTAAVLEMARILSVFRPNATFLFVCYSGEEQGLHGSRYHVAQLNASGQDQRIKAACNMDMIAYTSDADLDCLLETGGAGIPLLDIWSQAAATYTSLRIVTSTNPFGSDHVPFINDGVPALLTIENEYDNYPGYHRGTDTIEKITELMGVETIKMNLAALVGMSGFESLGDPIVIMQP